MKLNWIFLIVVFWVFPVLGLPTDSSSTKLLNGYKTISKFASDSLLTESFSINVKTNYLDPTMGLKRISKIKIGDGIPFMDEYSNISELISKDDLFIFPTSLKAKSKSKNELLINEIYVIPDDFISVTRYYLGDEDLKIIEIPNEIGTSLHKIITKYHFNIQDLESCFYINPKTAKVNILFGFSCLQKIDMESPMIDIMTIISEPISSFIHTVLSSFHPFPNIMPVDIPVYSNHSYKFPLLVESIKEFVTSINSKDKEIVFNKMISLANYFNLDALNDIFELNANYSSTQTLDLENVNDDVMIENKLKTIGISLPNSPLNYRLHSNDVIISITDSECKPDCSFIEDITRYNINFKGMPYYTTPLTIANFSFDKIGYLLINDKVRPYSNNYEIIKLDELFSLIDVFSIETFVDFYSGLIYSLQYFENSNISSGKTFTPYYVIKSSLNLIKAVPIINDNRTDESVLVSAYKNLRIGLTSLEIKADITTTFNFFQFSDLEELLFSSLIERDYTAAYKILLEIGNEIYKPLKCRIEGFRPITEDLTVNVVLENISIRDELDYKLQEVSSIASIEKKGISFIDSNIKLLPNILFNVDKFKENILKLKKISEKGWIVLPKNILFGNFEGSLLYKNISEDRKITEMEKSLGIYKLNDLNSEMNTLYNIGLVLQNQIFSIFNDSIFKRFVNDVIKQELKSYKDIFVYYNKIIFFLNIYELNKSIRDIVRNIVNMKEIILKEIENNNNNIDSDITDLLTMINEFKFINNKEDFVLNLEQINSIVTSTNRIEVYKSNDKLFNDDSLICTSNLESSSFSSQFDFNSYYIKQDYDDDDENYKLPELLKIKDLNLINRFDEIEDIENDYYYNDIIPTDVDLSFDEPLEVSTPISNISQEESELFERLVYDEPSDFGLEGDDYSNDESDYSNDESDYSNDEDDYSDEEDDYPNNEVDSSDNEDIVDLVMDALLNTGEEEDDEEVIDSLLDSLFQYQYNTDEHIQQTSLDSLQNPNQRQRVPSIPLPIPNTNTNRNRNININREIINESTNFDTVEQTLITLQRNLINSRAFAQTSLESNSLEVGPQIEGALTLEKLKSHLEPLVIHRCRAGYHRECIGRWVSRSQTCPNCRGFLQF